MNSSKGCFTVNRMIWSWLAVVALVGVGCGESDTVSRHDVTGTIQFDGQPVTEGTVTFLDPATSHAASGSLDESGNYLVQVPDGSYQVTVTPPLEEVASSNPNIAGGEAFKQVENIPVKYHREMTTDLSAEVSSSATEFDFELTP